MEYFGTIFKRKSSIKNMYKLFYAKKPKNSKGEAFGHFGLLNKVPRSATIIALEDIEVYVICKNDY